jgi:hypothetical protein
MADKSTPLTPKAGAVDAFLKAAEQIPAPSASARGRLIFALDATMSRQPTWDLSQTLQARMFQTAAAIGGLAVQLVYFRGFSECRASRFFADGRGLGDAMARIEVRGGATQIGKVLRHARDEARRAPVAALIFVGDAVEESADDLTARAGEMALAGVKAFMFQEGDDARAASTFRAIARLTGGAYAAFDPSAPDRLEALLRAAAAYAAGGRAGLQLAAGQDAQAQALLMQIK